MRNFYYYKRLLLAMLIALGSIGLPTSTFADSCKKRNNNNCTVECFTQQMQFQLFDAYDYPVENTQFWVAIQIHKEGDRISLSFPAINFETGQYAANDPWPPIWVATGVPVFTGGSLRSISGFLPESLRPSDPVYRSYLVPSNNGQSPAFSYSVPFTSFPQPPAGYILSVTWSGEIIIQSAGTFNNLIAPGPQIMMPTDVSYYVQPSKKLCSNIVVSAGASNITAFTDSRAANDGYRDTHFNDAFEGVVAFTWTDNSTVADKTNGTLNAMVAIGTVDANGNLQVGAPIQLTDLPPGIMAWDTAVAINRTNPKNIVVSYGVIDHVNNFLPLGPSLPGRAVSFDGGKTWKSYSTDTTTVPYPYIVALGYISGNILTITDAANMATATFGTLAVGQTLTTVDDFFTSGIIPYTTITAQLSGTPGGIGTYSISGPPQTVSSAANPIYIWSSPPLNGIIPILPGYSLGFGDARGVQADKFGNIVYSTTIKVDPTISFETNNPTFAMSSDGGVTFVPNIYTLPIASDFVPNVTLYDYPQFAFGGDGSGNYGFWFVCNYVHTGNLLDFVPVVGFVPITGLGTVGPIPAQTPSYLTSLTSTQNDSVLNINASLDGRVWIYTATNIASPYLASGVLYKSPGPINANWSGFWQTGLGEQFFNWNFFLGFFGLPPFFVFDSYPAVGWFDGNQSIVYDEQRKALYALAVQTTPSLSQNMRLYLIISRDNGMTWSLPIDVATTTLANRGIQTMALDPITGNLVFGWYDGRNDPTMESVQYFGALLTSSQLDCLVNQIPASDPLFVSPPATGCLGSGCTGPSGVLGLGIQDGYHDILDKLHHMESGISSLSAPHQGVAGPDMSKMSKHGKHFKQRIQKQRVHNLE